MIERSPSAKPPRRLFKESAGVFVFIHVVGISALAIADAQNDAHYFKVFALALIWASSSLVVSTYLSTRRAWQGLPAADFKDGVLPAIVIFALGWLLWTAVHALP
jgi:hypothetical protein